MTANSKTIEEMSLTELLDKLRELKRKERRAASTLDYVRRWALEEGCDAVLKQIERVIELEIEEEPEDDH